jgi:hypothetical protein
MPIPTKTYIIAGDHLRNRNEKKEIFHYQGDKVSKQYNMIVNVTKEISYDYTILYNKSGKLNDVVNYIITDINLLADKL